MLQPEIARGHRVYRNGTCYVRVMEIGRYAGFVGLPLIDEAPITHTRDMGNVQLFIREKKKYECILYAEGTYKMHSRGIYVRCTILLSS